MTPNLETIIQEKESLNQEIANSKILSGIGAASIVTGAYIFAKEIVNSAYISNGEYLKDPTLLIGVPVTLGILAVQAGYLASKGHVHRTYDGYDIEVPPFIASTMEGVILPAFSMGLFGLCGAMAGHYVNYVSEVLK